MQDNYFQGRPSMQKIMTILTVRAKVYLEIADMSRLCFCSYLDKAVSESCRADSCNTEDLPRTYNAYHLNGQTVTIDGKLDDPAWQEVPWTQSFMGNSKKKT